jgi:integrase
VFVLLLLYGMLRGEALALRWKDIDFDRQVIRIRQQVYRAVGELHIGPVKTRAGKRDLPLIRLARAALIARQEAQEALSGPVDVAAVTDVHYRDDACLVVNPVDDPVGAAPGAEPVVQGRE